MTSEANERMKRNDNDDDDDEAYPRMGKMGFFYDRSSGWVGVMDEGFPQRTSRPNTHMVSHDKASYYGGTLPPQNYIQLMPCMTEH